MSVNIFICMGNLTRDIELRYTTSGKAVGQSSIALNRKWKTEDGEQKEEVSFVEFSVFGQTAETMAEYFRKGSLIHLTGSIKQENWDDKQTGAKRTKLKMIVERFSFTGQSANGDGNAQPARPATRTVRPATRTETSEPVSKIEDDDNVPF